MFAGFFSCDCFYLFWFFFSFSFFLFLHFQLHCFLFTSQAVSYQSDLFHGIETTQDVVLKKFLEISALVGTSLNNQQALAYGNFLLVHMTYTRIHFYIWAVDMQKATKQQFNSHWKIRHSVDWGCRIHQLYFCRGVRKTPTNECPRYDTKQSDGEAPVMLELWRVWSTSLLSSLSGPLWTGLVALDRVLSMGQME